MKLFSCKEEYLKNAKSYQNHEKFLCKIVLNKDLYDIEMIEEEQKEIISVNNNDLFNLIILILIIYLGLYQNMFLKIIMNMDINYIKVIYLN